MRAVAIVGVGLIGGSFGLALRASGFDGRIVGVSSNQTIRKAIDLGAIDEGLPIERAVPVVDLIYLAQPIGRVLDTIRHLDALLPQPGALVTDAGSTKNAIVSAARASLRSCQFLGGHPMAGKETRGVESADAQLFAGRPYALTPGNPEELETPAARILVEWIKKMGARPVVIGAEEHDRLVAFSSHVPQLASTALAAALAESAPEASQVAGPGLVDATRLALSSYDLWRDILATNTDAISEALQIYITKLEHIHENLRTRQVKEEFERGADFARRLRD
ncbi:MAG: prephenate dehydrogenase/arogenate dehydrogenase family protein [Acidobacteriota bacterium]|nr:prephenate dehydrogenase/arogenate dehydrogenase family protein [Acidobacteriota bacterium]